jgi:hypothetical protein
MAPLKGYLALMALPQSSGQTGPGLQSNFALRRL